MFQSNWPSSDVQVVVTKDSTAVLNVLFFSWTVFDYVGYHAVPMHISVFL
jgi:hypothetical protein